MNTDQWWPVILITVSLGHLHEWVVEHINGYTIYMLMVERHGFQSPDICRLLYNHYFGGYEISWVSKKRDNFVNIQIQKLCTWSSIWNSYSLISQFVSQPTHAYHGIKHPTKVIWQYREGITLSPGQLLLSIWFHEYRDRVQSQCMFKITQPSLD